MLTVATSDNSRDCAGQSRRDFLRIGALGLGGLTLTNLLRTQAALAGPGAVGSPAFVRDKAVVVLFLGGGASHIETFDPKMTAPSEMRSVTGEIPTAIPGVTFGGNFPKLAKMADRLAVVRSFQHPVGDHSKAIIHVLTGGTDNVMSMGSTYARLRGTNHEATGIPTYAVINGPEQDPQYRKELQRIAEGSKPGPLGAAYAPFTVETQEGGKTSKSRDSRSGNPATDNMHLSIDRDRLADRRTLLESLDRLNRRIDATGVMEGMDRFEQQAIDLVLGSAGQAFDLSKEDPRLVKAYDTTGYRIGNLGKRPQFARKSTLGHQMLLARRLVEAGCGYVTVQSAGWDMHADGNNPGILDGMNMLGPTVDHAVSVFLDDLKSRGLSEKVLLVITGDFGRTPKINKNGGRDHWAKLGTLAFAGGGLNMGQVIGSSDRGAGEPATEPVSPQMMMATVMHTLFDVGELRLQTELPRELKALIENGEPIRELV